MQTIQTADLINQIALGHFDKDLDFIVNNIRHRQKALAPQSYQFRPGQRVWFNNKTNPQYLRGAEATVVRINPKKLVVRLAVPTGRYQGTITTPTNLIATEKPSYAV